MSSIRHGSSRSRRGLALVLAVALLGLSLSGTASFNGASAGAQTVEEKKQEAAEIAARLNELGQEFSALDEQYHQATMELEEADRGVTEAEARVAQMREELGVRQGEVQGYAVEAYMGGENVPGLDVVLGSDPDEVPTRRTYLSTASGDRQDLIDQLEAAQQDLDAEIANLEAAKAEAQAVRDDAAAAKEAAQGKIDEQEALEAKVEGELAELVRQEEARQAAAEAKRAEEAARAAAARANQAPPPAVTRTGGGGGGQAEAPAPEEEAGPGLPPPEGASGVVSLAYSLIGIPYVWGGGSPGTGFDCSGFTSYVWGQNGKSLPHSSAAQYGMTRRIPMSDLQPGDLVFYGKPSVHHVALYVGGGTIVHAPGTGRHVKSDSVYYWSELVGAGRLP
jgi:cell wall-associated NlpC family hydrolase